MKRLLLLLFSAALIVGTIAVVKRPSAPAAAAAPPVQRYVAAEGKLEALPGAEVNVGSALIARIDHYLVEVGSHVERGQTIALLDSHDLTAQLHQAEAALHRARAESLQAESDHARASRLHQRGFLSDAALDHAESARKVAAAHMAEAQAGLSYVHSMLDKTGVISPISGTLIERYLEPGEVAMPEKPLALIADTGRLRINAEVDETDAGRLRLGDPVEIVAYAYPGRRFKGRVADIADYVGKREIRPNNPAVNLGLKILQVKIELLEATPLMLGMTVDVRILPTGK